MNEVGCGLKEIKWNKNNEKWTEGNEMKHEQWSVNWKNWDKHKVYNVTAVQTCSSKKVLLKTSRENNCKVADPNAWRPATFLKETLTEVFSCEIPKIFKNTFFSIIPPVTAWESHR